MASLCRTLRKYIILIPLTTPGYNVPKSIPTKTKYVLLIRDQATSYTYFKIFDLIWWRQQKYSDVIPYHATISSWIGVKLWMPWCPGTTSFISDCPGACEGVCIEQSSAFGSSSWTLGQVLCFSSTRSWEHLSPPLLYSVSFGCRERTSHETDQLYIHPFLCLPLFGNLRIVVH